MIPIESLNHERDAASINRLYLEVGWHEGGEHEKKALKIFTSAADARVARIDGEVECMTLSHPGSLRYLDRDLAMCCVTGVTTSHVARRMGLAKRLTADLVARGATRGAKLAGLGMFDQGFYDQLGFGSGPYEHTVTFDPAQLRIDTPYRAPRRITPKDYEAIHACRLARFKQHGNASLLPVEITQGELIWAKKIFGLGYFDGPNGELSHFIYCKNLGGEHGPYAVNWVVYQTPEQLMELLALVKSLGDQVHAARMLEPAHIQLQDLMPQPIKQRRITEKSPFGLGNRAMAWWQVRMCDVPGCLAETSLNVAKPLSFNLELSDPITEHLASDTDWRGVAGEYVITLGEQSSAVPGSNASLPTLTATVNAFTRLWLGVRPARGLALTDTLSGPQALLDAIDDTLRVPVPRINWEF